MTVPSVSGRNEKIGTTLAGVTFLNAGGDFANVRADGADMWAFVAVASGSAMTSVSQSGTWKRFGFTSNPSGTNRTMMAIFYRKWTGAVATSTDNDVTFTAVPSDLNSPIVVQIIRVLNGDNVFYVGGPLVKMTDGNDTSPSFTPTAISSYVSEGLALYWQAAADNAPDTWTASGTGWTQEVAGTTDPGSGLGYVLASGPQSFPGGGINTCTTPSIDTTGTSQEATTLGILICGNGCIPFSPFVYDNLPAKPSDSLADITWSATDIANLGLMDGDLMVVHIAANRLSVNGGMFAPANWVARIDVGDITTANRLSHAVHTKIYSAAVEGSGITFICASNNATHGFIGTLFRVIGADRTTPDIISVGTATAIDISGTNTFTTGNITTTADNCLIMRFGAGAAASTRTFVWSDGTELTDDSCDPGGAAMTSVSWKTKLGIGAVGTATYTTNSTVTCLHGGQIAIAPVGLQSRSPIVVTKLAAIRASVR